MNYNLVEFFTSYGRLDQLPKTKNLEIIFAGKSNVGKSTLINKVFNRKNLARVSSVPGKTATINFFKLENIFFVDLPGYGYAKVSKEEKKRWSTLIGGYINDDRNIGLVLQLLDIRHKPTQNDIDMINFWVDACLPFVVVLTKKDKLNKTQLTKRLNDIKSEIPCGEDIKYFAVSSIKNDGFDELRNILDDVCDEFNETFVDEDTIENNEEI